MFIRTVLTNLLQSFYKSLLNSQVIVKIITDTDSNFLEGLLGMNCLTYLHMQHTFGLTHME